MGRCGCGKSCSGVWGRCGCGEGCSGVWVRSVSHYARGVGVSGCRVVAVDFP